MMTIEALLIDAIQHLEQAKTLIEQLRLAKREEEVDGRALSIAITHLETGQLWIANAKK